MTTASAGRQTALVSSFSYPLDLHYAYASSADGSAAQTTTVRQSLEDGRLRLVDDVPTEASVVRETVAPNDVLDLAADGSVSSHHGSSVADYLSADTLAGCVTRHEASTDSVLSAMSSTADCDLGGLLP